MRRLAALTNRGVLLSVHASVYALRLRVDGGRRATSFLLSGLRLHLYCRFHIRVLGCETMSAFNTYIDRTEMLDEVKCVWTDRPTYVSGLSGAHVHHVRCAKTFISWLFSPHDFATATATAVRVWCCPSTGTEYTIRYDTPFKKRPQHSSPCGVRTVPWTPECIR